MQTDTRTYEKQIVSCMDCGKVAADVTVKHNGVAGFTCPRCGQVQEPR